MIQIARNQEKDDWGRQHVNTLSNKISSHTSTRENNHDRNSLWSVLLALWRVPICILERPYFPFCPAFITNPQLGRDKNISSTACLGLHHDFEDRNWVPLLSRIHYKSATWSRHTIVPIMTSPVSSRHLSINSADEMGMYASRAANKSAVTTSSHGCYIKSTTNSFFAIDRSNKRVIERRPSLLWCDVLG